MDNTQNHRNLTEMTRRAVRAFTGQAEVNVAIKRFGRSESPVAPDLEICISAEPDKVNDIGWRRECLQALGECASYCSSTALDYVCLYLAPPAHVAIHFCESGEFVNGKYLWTSAPKANSPGPKRDPGESPKPKGMGQLSKTLLDLDCSVKIAASMAASKFARGELLEAVNKLSRVRKLLSSYLAQMCGRPIRPCCNQIENLYPSWVERFAATVPQEYSRRHILSALQAAVALHEYFLLGANPLFNGSGRHASYFRAIRNRPTRSEGAQGLGATAHREHAFEHISKLAGVASQFPWAIAVAVGGSWLGPRPTGEVGEFDGDSDLDVYVFCETMPSEDQWQDFVSGVGDVQAAVYVRTGYGMILYKDCLHKVDFRFALPELLEKPWEAPEIIWQRDSRVADVLAGHVPDPDNYDNPVASLDWINSVFWPSVVTINDRIESGRLFQAIEDLNSLRERVLGPFLAIVESVPYRGVRRLETRFPERVNLVADTVCGYDAAACSRALSAAVRCYDELTGMISDGQAPSRAIADSVRNSLLVGMDLGASVAVS